MPVLKKPLCVGVTMLVAASIIVQNFITTQAEKMGYIQSDCPAIVKQAMDTVSAECSKAGRNKLCYGNSTIQAVFQPGAGSVTFQAPGDTVDVAQIKQFTLGGMDTTTNTWGVAEMKIKADLPDTDPTQAVTFILFGNVQLTDASADANAAALSQTQGTKTAATATKLSGLENTATANALTPTPTGTIPALKTTQAAATATRLANLIRTATAPLQTPTQPAASNNLTGPYQDLQAFYFQSNESAPCDQAPHDGILIQSPQAKQRVILLIDGATVSLGSTVYVTAQANKFLTINTLEGSAQVTVGGQTQTAGAGSAIQVPLDANLRASGPPQTAQLYSADTIRSLPLQILPSLITPTPGLPSGVVASQWQTRFDLGVIVQGECVGGPFHPVTVIDSVAIDPNSNTIWWKHVTGNVELLSSTGSNTYNGKLSFLLVQTTDTLQLLSPTHAEGKDVETQENDTTRQVNCVESRLFHMDRLDSLTPTP